MQWHATSTETGGSPLINFFSIFKTGCFIMSTASENWFILAVLSYPPLKKLFLLPLTLVVGKNTSVNRFSSITIELFFLPVTDLHCSRAPIGALFRDCHQAFFRDCHQAVGAKSSMMLCAWRSPAFKQRLAFASNRDQWRVDRVLVRSRVTVPTITRYRWN